MINNPYYRIYRSNKKNQDEYVLDNRYCNIRGDLIRYYNLLQGEVLSLFNYIELDEDNFDTFSLKNYQILINICIEVENNLKGIISANTYIYSKKQDLTMEDYKKLEKYLKLSEYELEIKGIKLKPFEGFNDKKPFWYTVYNDIKHNRTTKIKEATLKNVVNALAGLYVLIYAQFGTYSVCTSNRFLTVAELDYGAANGENVISIFTITKFPLWNEKEEYDFNWNILKDEAEPFEKSIIN